MEPSYEDYGRPECANASKEPLSHEDDQQRLLCKDPCLLHNCACHGCCCCPGGGSKSSISRTAVYVSQIVYSSSRISITACYIRIKVQDMSPRAETREWVSPKKKMESDDVGVNEQGLDSITKANKLRQYLYTRPCTQGSDRTPSAPSCLDGRRRHC